MRMQVHSIILRKSFSIAPYDAPPSSRRRDFAHQPYKLYMQLVKLYMQIIVWMSSADKRKATQPGHFAGKRWQTGRRLHHEQDENDQPAGDGHDVVGRSSPRGAR